MTVANQGFCTKTFQLISEEEYQTLEEQAQRKEISDRHERVLKEYWVKIMLIIQETEQSV